MVVGFHNCMYCTNLVHSSDGGNRSRWEPIFDKHRVDLVVNGHNHCYERTHLMRAGAPVQEAPRGAVVDSRRGHDVPHRRRRRARPSIPSGGLPAAYVTMEGGIRVPEADDVRRRRRQPALHRLRRRHPAPSRPARRRCG